MVRGMAWIAFATNVGLVIVAGLACWDAYVERASPARRRKFLGAALAVVVTVGTLYLRHAQAREMAFVNAMASETLRACFGGL